MYIVKYDCFDSISVLAGVGGFTEFADYYFMDEKDAQEYIEEELLKDLTDLIMDSDESKQLITVINRDEHPCIEHYCNLSSKGESGCAYNIDIYIYKLDLYQKN